MRNPTLPVAFLSALMLGAAQAGTPATPAAMAAYAEKLLDEQKINREGPGLTVLVARGDQLLYQGARGMASIELGVPMKPEYFLRIGSVTKQFAAATLLKLVDEGKVKLDDPLSKYLPDYPNGAQITVLQLLNHTSGIKSYTGIPGYMNSQIRRDLDTASLVKEFKDQPVDFAPGQSWAYNNSGYVLVGAVIEAASGKTWHQQLNDSLLAPNKLDVTIRYQASDQIFKGMVQGYTMSGDGKVVPAGLISMTQPHAAGALIANVESLWRWNQALHGGKLLSSASYQRMITPEGSAKPQNYGFGITTNTLRGQPVLMHGGGIHGFVSTLNYLPQGQVTVAIVRNNNGAGPNLDLLWRKLAAFAIGEPFQDPKPVAVPAEQLKAAEGLFALDDKQTRMLRVKDGVLQSQRGGSSGFGLIPLGGDRFAFPDSVSYLTLERGADGKVVAMRVFNNGEGEGERWARRGDLPAERAAITLTPAQIQALVGEYSSPQFSMKIFVNDKGVLTTQAAGQGPAELKAATPRLLYLTVVDATLEFSAEEGVAQSVTLNQGSTKLVMKRK